MLKFNPAKSSYRNFYLLSVTYLLAVLIINKPVTADEDKQRPIQTVSPQFTIPPYYCGVSCLYTIMKLYGNNIEYLELVKPEIVSRKGISLAKLKKAAEDNGLYAVPVAKLTSSGLNNSPYPVILHVKSDPASTVYDHYEVFLGTKNGQAQLFDPPQPVRLVPFRQLAPRWDGNGLIVSAEPINLGPIFAPARRRFIIYATISIAIILIVRWARGRWLLSLATVVRRKLLYFSVAQGVGLAVASILCGMLYHFANDEGFLAHADATASIQQAHRAEFIPKVNKNKVRRLLNNDTIFIDARTVRDFQAAHLDGAINVPVDANDRQRHKVLANIGKNAHIVVYCQSVSCKFAESVAIKLRDDGYSDVSIFKGGWQEWEGKTENSGTVTPCYTND